VKVRALFGFDVPSLIHLLVAVPQDDAKAASVNQLVGQLLDHAGLRASVLFAASEPFVLSTRDFMLRRPGLEDLGQTPSRLPGTNPLI